MMEATRKFRASDVRLPEEQVSPTWSQVRDPSSLGDLVTTGSRYSNHRQRPLPLHTPEQHSPFAVQAALGSTDS